MTAPLTPEALVEALAEFQRRNGYHRPEIEELLMEFGELVLATATSELARLRAEGEAKDRRIAAMTEALKPFAEYARLSDEAGLNIGPGEIGEFIHGGLRRSIHTRDLEAASTTLARAATAREGA